MVRAVKGCRGEGGIRNHTPFDRTSQGENCHLSSVGCKEDFGTFIDGRASGEDIVDEQDALTGDFPGMAQGKCHTQVLQAG
jgi:hypothetical protein